TTRGTWWVVNAAAVPVKVQGLEETLTPGETVSGQNLTEEELTVMKMEAEEESRLVQEELESTTHEFEFEQDENTEWLRTSEWPQWFRNRPLHVIVAASKTPSTLVSAYSLGNWVGEELISPAAQEAVLRTLTSLAEHVLQRCEETLQSTPRALRCWVKSATASSFPRPFETVQRSNTRKRYYQYWNRFLCYTFRAHLISRAYGMKMQEVFGLELSKPQTKMIDFVYAAAMGLDSHDIGAFNVLTENLFQLFAMFWTDISKDGRMETFALVHFTGVLGIHPRELAYQTAYGFTPALSAMAWIGRLILLEYALPLKAYSQLKFPWPSRTQYPDQVQRLRDQIHPKYMRKGCFSPLGYICERIHHARTIANREGPRTNISWSPDMQVLSIAGQEISMPYLRQAAHLAVARSEQRARQLMLGLWPNVDLSKIKDSLVTHRPGHSFLSEPENELQMSFKLLSRRAFSKDGGFSLRGLGRKRAVQYLKDRDELVKHMYGGLHIPSGMPARTEELRLIRWADTVAVQRNIFVLQGRMMFLKTLAFQTGHTIQTHSRSYALDNQYPARLQSDLIGRYYQSSLLWHRFLLLGEGDPLLLQSDEQGQNEPFQTIGYSPDLHLVAQDDEPESIEIESEAQDEVKVQSPESRNNIQENRSLVRRQRPPRATRKRAQVEILEDTTVESDDDFAPVNRQAERRNKKPKITHNGGEVVLRKLMEMQEELNKMVSNYQKGMGVL
ncbi:hypothetical protein V502_02791, partial [Pseudogymnoascus sp. VKM F-4520 (FW-2644)]